MRQTLDITDIDHLILDEADEMLNMGFVEDIEQIMEYTNPNKRTLLFSATIPKRIKELAKKYMDGYELLTRREKAADDKSNRADIFRSESSGQVRSPSVE